MRAWSTIVVEWRPQVCHVGGAAGNLKGARDPGSHRLKLGILRCNTFITVKFNREWL
jgi:hypothetical protein